MGQENNWGSLTTYQKIKDILGVLGSLSFFTLFIINIYSISVIMKSNNYNNDVIGRCMDKYSKMSVDLRNYKMGKQTDSISVTNLMYQYFDVTNEELFYIRNGVVNPEVSSDWMTGMIKQIKLFSKEKNYKTIQDEFPRIKNTFDINLLDIETDKGISKETIQKCMKNLKEYNYNK